jgi:hypothetical protein
MHQMNGSVTGYLHPDYARSLAEFGEPRELPACGGWILVRPIPGMDANDAMGCYPLFACQNWEAIHDDMDKLKDDLVSLVLVTDPFAAVEPQYLREHFAIARPFKKHLITSLKDDWESSVDKHHRYYAKKSLRDMNVEIILQPEVMLNEWYELYRYLVTRHNITGIQAFSRTCFERQLKLPGLFMVVGRLKSNHQVIGIHLVINHGQYSYSHLAAFSQEGYKICAAYGIYWETLKYLHSIQCQYFDLGAAAGLEDDPDDGLSRFKKGWSDDSRLVYLCGRIFDELKYSAICTEKNIPLTTEYFPAYRKCGD